MTDIYPQSPEDSHAVLSEMHPLSQKLETLGRQLKQANQRVDELEEKCRALEAEREEMGRQVGELLTEKALQQVRLDRELEAANRRIVELDMALESSQVEIDISLEDCEREQARHKITQNNLRQVQQQCDHLTKTIQAIHAVMMIGEAPF